MTGHHPHESPVEVASILTQVGARLSVEARMLLLTLVRHLRADGAVPSETVLMQELALGERRLRQALVQLERQGLVSVSRRPGRLNGYSMDLERLVRAAGANPLRDAGTQPRPLSIPPPPAPISTSTTAKPGARMRADRDGGVGERALRSHHGEPRQVLVAELKSLLEEAGVAVPRVLVSRLREWALAGVTVADAEYATEEAALSGSRNFRYVEAIFRRLLQEQNGAVPVEGDGPVSLAVYRQGRQR